MVRRRWRIAGIAVIAAALAAGAACTRKGDVHVKVVCENVPGAKPIERLTVFVGGSKSSWPVVVPGDSVSVVLPPEGEPPQVSAIYSIGGSRKEWRGPAMDAWSSAIAPGRATCSDARENGCPHAHTRRRWLSAEDPHPG
jgi:hypothetical protein